MSTVARRTGSSTFPSAALTRLTDVSAAARHPLARLDVHRRSVELAAAVMGALSCGLRDPCAVLDHQGRVLWVNETARQQYGIEVLTLGDLREPAMETGPVPLWHQAVRAASELPSSAPIDGTPTSIYGITVTRVLRPGKSPVYVVVGAVTPTLAGLTHREREVVELTTQGHSTASVAVLLAMSEGTVRQHMKRIYRKLQVSSRMELLLRVLGR